MLRTKSLSTLLLCVIALLGGCVTIDTLDPRWPASARDEISVRPSLRQLLANGRELKVVLRVPNAQSSVTSSEKAQAVSDQESMLTAAYDTIEKKLFEAGFVVRDRALLTNLLRGEITTYQEIKTRVDTDLIIDLSSLRFNAIQDRLVTTNYVNQQGVPGTLAEWTPRMGQSVASVQAKIIIVATGEVGGIITLSSPVCGRVSCRYMLQDGYYMYLPQGSQVSVVDDEANKAKVYTWASGTGVGSVADAAERIAEKIVQALQN